MKKYLLTIAFITTLTFSTSLFAQNFDEIESCKELDAQVQKAIAKNAEIDNLLTSQNIEKINFLKELYTAVQIISESSTLFLNASKDHESSCKNSLKIAANHDQLLKIYNLALIPIEKNLSFYKRARKLAINLAAQDNVDQINAIIEEYKKASLKVVALCKSDFDEKNTTKCDELTKRFNDALKND